MTKVLVIIFAVFVLTSAKSVHIQKVPPKSSNTQHPPLTTTTRATVSNENKFDSSGTKDGEATTIIPGEPKPLEFKTFSVLPAILPEEPKTVKEKPKKSRRGKKPRKPLAYIRVLNQEEVEQSNTVTTGRRSKVRPVMDIDAAASNIAETMIKTVPMSTKQAKAINSQRRKGKRSDSLR